MKIMKSCLPIVRYAPPLIIEISIFTKMVRIRASPPSASRAASSYPARKFSNNFPKFSKVGKNFAKTFCKFLQSLQSCQNFANLAKFAKFAKLQKKIANLAKFCDVCKLPKICKILQILQSCQTFCKSCKMLQAFWKSLQGSFSAVSTPIFASKYSLESSRRDLHNALLCTVLQSQNFS